MDGWNSTQGKASKVGPKTENVRDKNALRLHPESIFGDQGRIGAGSESVEMCGAISQRAPKCVIHLPEAEVRIGEENVGVKSDWRYRGATRSSPQ